MDYAERAVRMSVADDGRGFDAESPVNALCGHFGLLGMNERARRIGADLRITSRPRQGAEVAVTLRYETAS